MYYRIHGNANGNGNDNGVLEMHDSTRVRVHGTRYTIHDTKRDTMYQSKQSRQLPQVLTFLSMIQSLTSTAAVVCSWWWCWCGWLVGCMYLYRNEIALPISYP